MCGNMASNNNTMTVFSKLEKFNGKEDLKSWFQKFNRCCTIAQKTEEDIKGQLIMLCLSGQALAVAEQLEYECDGTQTYAQVKTRLESVFDSSAGRERRMIDFENRTQRADETEDEFMLSLVQLYRSANPQTPDAEFQKSVKRKFLQGISAELRRAIFVFNSDPHSTVVTYQRLLEYARNARLNIVDTTVESTSMSVNSINQHEGAAAASTNINNELLQAINNLTSSVNEHLSLFRDQQADSVNVTSGNTNRGGRSRNRSRGRWRGRNNRQYDNEPIRCHKCNCPNHLATHCMQRK